MTLIASLRSRVFLASALPAVLAIGVAVYLVSVRVTADAERTLQREIVSTAALVDQLRTTRMGTFMQMARFIADAPRVKAAVDTNDPPTVQDIAEEYQGQLKSNVLVVTNRSGDVLATVGASGRTALLVASQPAIRVALGAHESFTILAQPDGMLQLVTVPIALGLTHAEILGTLTAGFMVDNALAEQLKSATGSDIVFGMDGHVLAATLPREYYPALAGQLGTDGISQISLGGEDYMMSPRTLTMAEPAAGAGAGPVALILRSRTEQLRSLRAVHTALGMTAVLAVAAATLFSFAVARTITRPLAAITNIMREMAATGDLTLKIALRQGHRWDDEDARLLATTFNTLTDSIARFQVEMSQKERLTALGRLSTVIAHEIRNPLMIIKAALHLLGRSGVAATEMREALADIDEEVTRLNRVVNDVLDFARPIHFELAPADLNALCRDSVAAVARATAGPAVHLDLDPAMPVVTTDAERLRLALVNMLVNARHAAGAAERPEPRVTLRTERRNDRAIIQVVDCGVGIAPADLPHVSDPYFTTKRGGTGLGLPIARNIVEGLGGTLTVASVVGDGTEVTMDLPLDSSSPAPAAHSASTH
jgi:signal transduction histidine kinase